MCVLAITIVLSEDVGDAFSTRIGGKNRMKIHNIVVAKLWQEADRWWKGWEIIHTHTHTTIRI